MIWHKVVENAHQNHSQEHANQCHLTPWKKYSQEKNQEKASWSECSSSCQQNAPNWCFTKNKKLKHVCRCRFLCIHTQFLRYKSMKNLHLIQFQPPFWQMQCWSSKVNLWSPALSKQHWMELYQIITIFVVQSRRSISILLWHQMDVQKRQNLLQRKKILLVSKKNVGCFFSIAYPRSLRRGYSQTFMRIQFSAQTN